MHISHEPCRGLTGRKSCSSPGRPPWRAWPRGRRSSENPRSTPHPTAQAVWSTDDDGYRKGFWSTGAGEPLLTVRLDCAAGNHVDLAGSWWGVCMEPQLPERYGRTNTVSTKGEFSCGQTPPWRIRHTDTACILQGVESATMSPVRYAILHSM